MRLLHGTAQIAVANRKFHAHETLGIVPVDKGRTGNFCDRADLFQGNLGTIEGRDLQVGDVIFVFPVFLVVADADVELPLSLVFFGGGFSAKGHFQNGLGICR